MRKTNPIGPGGFRGRSLRQALRGARRCAEHTLPGGAAGPCAGRRGAFVRGISLRCLRDTKILWVVRLPVCSGTGKGTFGRGHGRPAAQRPWSKVTTAASVACTVRAAFLTSHRSGTSPSAWYSGSP
jgi:hypothetical protein